MTISDSKEDPTTTEVLSAVVAIVHTNTDGAAIIWYVDTDPVTDLNRLSGAWVTANADQHQSLLTRRRILQVADSLIPGVLPAPPQIDPNATRQAIIDEVGRLHQVHRKTPTKAGNIRAPIEWPDIPNVLDFESLPPVPAGVSREDPAITDTVAVAYWIQELAESWSRIETVRCAREHLRGDNPAPRQIPFAAPS